MEIFVKRNVIAPVRVIIEIVVVPEYGPLPIRATKENSAQPLGHVVSDFG
jgi:hypothetical protein